MNASWKKDDNSISLIITDGKTKIGVHFEDVLKGSSFTYSGEDEIWAGLIPIEFLEELRIHLNRVM